MRYSNGDGVDASFEDKAAALGFASSVAPAAPTTDAGVTPTRSPANPAPIAVPTVAPESGAEMVAPANFVRAESDTYMANLAKEAGGIGKLLHHREPASIDHQNVVRLNRDTLYSSAVFDLDAGPVTVTLPDPGKRFQSLQFINQDHQFGACDDATVNWIPVSPDGIARCGCIARSRPSWTAAGSFPNRCRCLRDHTSTPARRRDDGIPGAAVAGDFAVSGAFICDNVSHGARGRICA